jgi:IclR family pca regulon transcriptional regulator
MLRRTRAVKKHSDPDYMLSLARGLSVVRAFSAGPVLSIAEVARLTRMSRAAARRCLHTLAALGYVVGKDGSYELSPRVLSLGHAYLGSAPVVRSAQPVLERVAERLHESCSLSVLDGSEIVYVARAATRRILSVGLSVGSRLPAYCTSMGRVLLAFASDASRATYFAGFKPVRYTPRTLVGRSALARELARVRVAGYALVDQELEIGLRSIAVPVRRQDQVVIAAMNVGVQATRVELATMTRDYLPVLRSAAEEIGLTLGYGRETPGRLSRG